MSKVIQGKCSLNIDKKITEQMIIENCLMLKYSGLDYMTIFSFYTLGIGMNYKKFAYYLNLLGEKND
jgi:hypothetical protein